MKKTAAHTTTNNINSDPALSLGSLHVVRSFADTTWRIAVPVLLFTMAGIVFDKHFGSKPWATLVGTAIGFVIAGWLVKRQLGDALEDKE
jgi:gamma-glutamyltranspeptidase